MASSVFANSRMAARALTAIVGGYAAAAGSVSFASRVAPIERAEATIWAMTLSFLVYAAVMLWAFHEPRVLRVVMVIWGVAIAAAACLWLLGSVP